MARGYEVAVGADGRAFNQALRQDVIKPVEDAARSLDELADAGEDAGRDAARGLEQIEDGLKEVERAADKTGDDSERALGKLERALRDAQQQAGKTENALDDVGDTGVKGMGKIKAGADEVTNEGFANAAEAVSSFRGDLSDLGQIGQDTLGGLAGTIAGMGPAGIVGAITLAAGAAGWGLIAQNLEDQAKAADELRDRLSSAYQTAADEGRDYLVVADFIAEKNDLMFNPERAEEWKRLQEEAKLLHIDQSTIIKANAGDLASQEVVQKAINELVDEQKDKQSSLLNHEITKDLEGIQDRWHGITDATNDQIDAARNSARLTSEFLLGAASQAKSATSEVDKFGNELIKLPDGTEFVIDAETKQAHQDMDRFYGDADKKIERLKRKDIRLRLRVDDTAVDNYRPPVIKGTVVYTGQAGTRQRG